YYENGNIKQVLYTFANGEEVLNPMYNATLGTKDEKAYDDFINNFSLEWDIIEGMKLKTKISLNKKTLTADKFLPGDHTDFYGNSLNGSYTKTLTEYFSYDANVTLAYTKRLAKHLLNAAAVWNVKQARTDQFSTTAYNFPNNNMDHISMGIQYGKGDKPVGNYEESRLMGVVANFNYGFDDRYLADFSIRSDASSLFGADKRWGTFGSVGIGWNIHNESWFNKSGLFSQLKVRGSWGSTGGQNFYPYQAMMMFSYKDELLNRQDSENETVGMSYDGFVGALLKAFGNTGLKWQKTEKLNAGIDFALFDNRLSGYFNYYKETSKSVLTDVRVAPSLGFSSYKDNLGEVENKGVEVNLKATLIRSERKSLQWDVFVSLVRNRNRLLKLNEALVAWNKNQDETSVKDEVKGPVVRYQEGQSIHTIWANESLGIDPVTGDEVFLSRNGQKVSEWSTENYKPLGCEDPKFEGNFGTMLRYKNFMLQAYFKYSYGGDIYNKTLVDKVE
ncbi:MAG: TonB-dependent receptor, partial [Odoribacter sp.]|nr:TonB-dependent receptor [Odoribacter sp.]